MMVAIERVQLNPADRGDCRGYGVFPIEKLAEVIHRMAAVAWDRDMADVELAPSEAGGAPMMRDDAPGEKLPALRFCANVVLIEKPKPGMLHHQTRWCAMTGDAGTIAAYWDPDTERWVRLLT